MFVVLDTNHYTEFADGSALGRNLLQRIETNRADVFTCIVCVQETVQGWLALINRNKSARKQLPAYARFQSSIETLTKLAILPFDEEAATHLESLQRKRLRIGTMDLKIASIWLAHDATLLTRNLVDFAKVPGLKVENWLA